MILLAAIENKILLYDWVQRVYNSQLNQLQNHMSSAPRISFNKQIGNTNSQPYSVYNPGLPNNGYYNYETRPANVLNTVMTPVELSQKPQTVIVEKSSVVEQIPRPQYEKTYNSSAPNKRLAPQRDPPAKSTCCTPCWWVVATLIGLAGLTLALLYGLNVIGAPDVQKVSSGFSPRASSTTSISSTLATTSASSNTNTTTNTNKTTNTSMTTTNSTNTTGVTGSTSTNTQLNAGSIAPASIPAQPLATTSHQAAEDKPSRVTLNGQQRHRLSVNY